MNSHYRDRRMRPQVAAPARVHVNGPLTRAVGPSLFACAILVVSMLTLSGSPAFADAGECAPVQVVGVPGTSQGAAHHPGATDSTSLYGGEVAEAIRGLNEVVDSPGQVVATPINYPAVGVPNVLDYDRSKDSGYSALWSTVRSIARSCAGSKFVLVGFSQGAHIVGDLTQTIFDEGSPISRDRLVQSVLIADPALTWPSVGVTWVRGGPPPAAPVYGVTSGGGFTGQGRAAWSAEDPVSSICDWTDPICDFTLGVNFGAHNYTGGPALAAGQQAGAAVIGAVPSLREQAQPAPPVVPAAPAGFTILDNTYGGSWARTDPSDGTWHGRDAAPANAAWWYPNGLGVAVDCQVQAAAYPVYWADGHVETWTTWLHVTDGKFVPSAATEQILTDGPNGLPNC